MLLSKEALTLKFIFVYLVCKNHIVKVIIMVELPYIKTIPSSRQKYICLHPLEDLKSTNKFVLLSQISINKLGQYYGELKLQFSGLFPLCQITQEEQDLSTKLFMKKISWPVKVQLITQQTLNLFNYLRKNFKKKESN